MTLQDEKKKKTPRKMTKIRLKNIALYYLKRFESSVQNLRDVLKRRVDAYAFQIPEFDKKEAYAWIEEILKDCESWHYLDDERYTKIKIRDYLNAGKPKRYIENKLRQKGISAPIDAFLADEEYDPHLMAQKMMKKKKMGPYRSEMRKEFYAKDLASLVRAGFDYDLASEVLTENLDDQPDF